MPDLMIAGPGQVHDEELEILGRQLIAHYGDIWTELHNTALHELGALLGAADVPYSNRWRSHSLVLARIGWATVTEGS